MAQTPCAPRGPPQPSSAPTPTGGGGPVWTMPGMWPAAGERVACPAAWSRVWAGGLLPGWGGATSALPPTPQIPLLPGSTGHFSAAAQGPVLKICLSPEEKRGPRGQLLRASSSSHHHRGHELRQLFKEMSTQTPEHMALGQLSEPERRRMGFQAAGPRGGEEAQEAPQEFWLHFLHTSHGPTEPGPHVHYPLSLNF